MSGNQNFQSTTLNLGSFDPDGVAVIFGAGGGIGSALVSALTAADYFKAIVPVSRNGIVQMDLEDEPSVAEAVHYATSEGDIRLAIDATGFLHNPDVSPEKSLRDIDATHLAHAFAVNAIGPALIMKHLLPHLPRRKKTVFATLSARVGSIGDNRLGGWYAYRSSKAALNQLVRTAAVELKRRAPEAVCIALHPGTVATPLSAPFTKTRSDLSTPNRTAYQILSVVNRLDADATSGFFDWRGKRIKW